MDTGYFSPPRERNPEAYGPTVLANRERCYMSAALFIGGSMARRKQMNDR